MLTQLQLEGPELEPLLARVRTELGPHARIVHAEKIRSGGVAGFFAHQRFEITVEVDTSLPRTAAAPAVPIAVPIAVPTAVPTARAAAPVVPAARAAYEAPVAAPEPEPSAAGVPAFSAIAGLDGDEGGPSRFSALAGLTTPAPTRRAAAAAHVYAPHTTSVALSEERDELPSVLAAALQGRPTAPPPPPRAPVEAPVATAFAPAGFEPYAPYAGVVDAIPADEVAPPSSLLELADRISQDEADRLVSTESPSFAALLSRLGDDIGALGDDDPGTSPEPPSCGGAVPDADPLDPAPAPVVPTAVPDTGTVAVRPPAEAVVHDPAAVEPGPAAGLARLGLPPHLRPDGVGEALHTALRASLSRLPTAPPAMNRAGSVLAVVGPLAQALHVAREIAAELGLPAATSVAVATAGPAGPDIAERQVLHGAAEAAERRSTWRRRSNLTVVAVDAPLTASGAAEARAFLTALSPTATWGVVEATRKAQDVGCWTRALGGVHALALTELEETSDPAAVLELGIPVSRLGGRPATPRAWATLLTGRLAA